MPEPQQSPPRSIRIHYLKTSGYRTIHADGAVCGLTPSGRGLHIAFFSERATIPQMTEHTVEQDGILGPVLSSTGKDGVVREIEVDAFIDLESAKALSKLLSDKIADLERLLQGKPS